MNSYYLSLAVFFVLAYFIATDSSIARFVVYASRLVKFQYEKTKWWIWMNPKTPWARYIMWRRSYKLAKELQEELESKNK